MVSRPRSRGRQRPSSSPTDAGRAGSPRGRPDPTPSFLRSSPAAPGPAGPGASPPQEQRARPAARFPSASSVCLSGVPGTRVSAARPARATCRGGEVAHLGVLEIPYCPVPRSSAAPSIRCTTSTSAGRLANGLLQPVGVADPAAPRHAVEAGDHRDRQGLLGLGRPATGRRPARPRSRPGRGGRRGLRRRSPRWRAGRRPDALLGQVLFEQRGQHHRPDPGRLQAPQPVQASGQRRGRGDQRVAQLQPEVAGYADRPYGAPPATGRPVDYFFWSTSS